jgi:hypothetical protein
VVVVGVVVVVVVVVLVLPGGGENFVVGEEGLVVVGAVAPVDSQVDSACERSAASCC